MLTEKEKDEGITLDMLSEREVIIRAGREVQRVSELRGEALGKVKAWEELLALAGSEFINGDEAHARVLRDIAKTRIEVGGKDYREVVDKTSQQYMEAATILSM